MLSLNASTKHYLKTLPLNASTKRKHQTLPLMGATRLASGMNAKAHKTVLIIRLSVSLYLMYKHGIFPDARRVAPIRGSVL